MGLESRGWDAKARVAVVRLCVLLLVVACACASSGQQGVARRLVARVQMVPSADIAVGTSMAFDASGSSFDVPQDLVNEVRYTWDLGDATAQVGERVVHTYDLPGTYRVVLIMDVFENTGIYHRATATAAVTVLPAEAVPQGAAFDLESGFAMTVDFGAIALTWLPPQATTQPSGGPALSAPEPSQVGGGSPGALRGLVFSGGIAALGELTLWNVSLGVDVLDDGVLLLAGYGLSTGEATVSLTGNFPRISEAGGEVAAEIQHATLYSFGVGYRALPQMYVVGEVGLLVVDGIYTGSSRVTIDGRTLPVPFSEGTTSFGVGIVFRVGALAVSAKLLFPL
jgi:PKD repeat protein